MDWARPVVHWEIVARDPERQAAFYRDLCHWEIGEGPIMPVSPGLGGPEPGPAGHIRRGDKPGVILYVQVRDLRASLDRAVALGATLVTEPFDVPGGPTEPGGRTGQVQGDNSPGSKEAPSDVRRPCDPMPTAVNSRSRPTPAPPAPASACATDTEVIAASHADAERFASSSHAARGYGP